MLSLPHQGCFALIKMGVMSPKAVFSWHFQKMLYEDSKVDAKVF